MNFCRPVRVYPAAPFWKKSLLSLLLHLLFIWAIDPGAEISKCIQGKLGHSRRCRMVGGRRRLRGNNNQMPTGRNTTGRKGKLMKRTAFFSGCVKRMYIQAYIHERWWKFPCMCVWVDTSLTQKHSSFHSVSPISASLSVILCLVHLSHAQTLSWTLSVGQDCNSTPPSFVPFSCSYPFIFFNFLGKWGSLMGQKRL